MKKIKEFIKKHIPKDFEVKKFIKQMVLFVLLCGLLLGIVAQFERCSVPAFAVEDQRQDLNENSTDNSLASSQFRMFNSDLDWSMFGDNDDYVFDYFRLSVVDSDYVTTSNEGFYISTYEDTISLFYDGTYLQIMNNVGFIKVSYRLVYIESLGDTSQDGFSKLEEFFEVNSVIVHDLTPFISYNNDLADAYYKVGYAIGKRDAELDYQDAYNRGYNEGLNVGQSSEVGKNLLGDTLRVPVEALDGFVLYTTSTGYDVTLWGVVGALIGFALFVWFLKMFAGG